MKAQFYSQRKEKASGYLELIFRQDPNANPDKNVQAIAYITDHYSVDRPFFTGYYGIHEFNGSTVATVKDALFAAINEGL